jgi:N-acetylglucosamine-6-phosphate deacetylase
MWRGSVPGIMATRVVVMVAAMVAAGCSGTALPSQTPTTTVTGADLILGNGTILTMDPARPRAEAVAVTDGVIVAVGTRDEVGRLRTETTAVVDLGGAALMPGFVDAHSHFFDLPDANANAASPPSIAARFASTAERVGFCVRAYSKPLCRPTASCT